MKQIAIVGGGVVGAAIAYELSCTAGMQVTLLEGATEFATQSTGAALGVLMGAISRKTKGRAWKLRQASLRRYQTLIPELEALTGKAIAFNRQGILKLVRSTDDWAKWHDEFLGLRREQGWQLERWTPAEIARRQPDLDLTGCLGGIYSPQDGQVDPVELTQALIAGARLQGADCRCGVRVLEIPRAEGGCCDRLITTAGEIRCDGAIVTAGLGSMALTGSDPSFQLQPVLGQARRVRLSRELNVGFTPVVTADDVHLMPLGDREYWVGATVEFGEAERAAVAAPEALATVWEGAISFCPALAAAEIVREWWGLRPRPMGQGAPVVKQLAGFTNVWLATGHYRNGVLLAPATALVLGGISQAMV
ncbi:MAG: FAD-dependent oxidoreductase [Cyanobacteria bacterium J06641_5]